MVTFVKTIIAMVMGCVLSLLVHFCQMNPEAIEPTVKFSEDMDTCFIHAEQNDTLYIEFFMERGIGYIMNYHDKKGAYGVASLKQDSDQWELIRHEDSGTIRYTIKKSNLVGFDTW